MTPGFITGPASLESILPHITAPGKEQNAKLHVWFSLDTFTPLQSQKILSQTIISQRLFVERNLINFRKLFLQNKNYSIQNNFLRYKKNKAKYLED